jgi:hypothetical protein
MYFLDVKERRISKVRESLVCDLPIKTDLSLIPIEKTVDEITQVLDGAAATTKFGKKPIIFDFTVKFEGEEEDFAALTDLIISIFCR